MAKQENPLTKRLIDQYGGRRKAADVLEVSVETIRLWLRDGIPLERAIDIEEKSFGVVTAEEVLRDARRVARRTEKARAVA